MERSKVSLFNKSLEFLNWNRSGRWCLSLKVEKTLRFISTALISLPVEMLSYDLWPPLEHKLLEKWNRQVVFFLNQGISIDSAQCENPCLAHSFWDVGQISNSFFPDCTNPSHLSESWDFVFHDDTRVSVLAFASWVTWKSHWTCLTLCVS